MNNTRVQHRKIFIIFILIFLVVLQSTLLDCIKIFNIKPDIVLAAIILISLSLDLRWVMASAYIAGFFKDMLGAHHLGLYTLVLPLLGFLGFKLSKRIVIETNYMRGLVIFMAVILENIIVSLLLTLLGLDISISMFFKFTIVGSIYTALLFLLLSKIIRIVQIKFYY